MLIELRHALRRLRRNPELTTVHVLCLALVVGANAALVGALDAVLFRPLRVPDVDRLASVYELPVGASREERMRVSYPTYEDWRRGAAGVTSLAAVSSVRLTLSTSGPEVEPVSGEITSASYFEVLGVHPLLGRVFRPEESTPPEPGRLCLLGHGLWQRHFGGDPSVVGRAIALDRLPFTVLGVMPPGFRGLHGTTEVWVPLSVQADVMHRELLARRGSHWLQVVARLEPGTDVEQAEAVLHAVARRLNAQYPEVQRDRGVLVLPLRESLISPGVRRALWTLTGAGGLLLLIAYANLAGLQLTTLQARRHELAVRTALGASRRRLIRLLVMENVVLSLLGGAGALLVARGGIAGLEALKPPRIARLAIDFDLPTIASGLALALVLGLLLGVASALAASDGEVAHPLREPGP